jgi:polysaccharide pyruvyl transferase WcaK-like protein
LERSYPGRLPAKPTLIVGGYGYRNAGDEAILAGLLQLTGRDGVTVVSRAPAETAATHGVTSIRLADAPAALLRHRGVIIGGGGLFGRDMGLLGRVLPLAGLAATVARREVALLGIGADAEMPRSARPLVRALGRRATSTVVRDADSRSVLAGLGVDALIAPDLSSLVPSAGARAGRRVLEAAGLHPARRPVVGLCLTDIDPDLARSVVRAVLDAVDALPELDFCLIPMARHPFVARHNDEVLARRLIAQRPRLRLVEPPQDTATLLGVFDALGAAVCMRYHSFVFAERAGLPIVAFPYAAKCRTWLAERGLEPDEPSAAAIVDILRGGVVRAAA